jgi:hypothetical protein
MLRAVVTKCLIIPMILVQVALSCPAFASCEQAKLSASDANADDRFGVSVAIDGNIAVVGAYQNDSNGPDSGAVYVYELSGSQWVQQQKLTASDASTGDQFGRSVAVYGNTIVVGSYLDDNSIGSAYVFACASGIWSQQQKLTASDANTADKFGGSVSISNDTIVVGAYGDDKYTGSAYVFARNGPAWSQQQKLTASDAATGDYFGCSVAVDDNTIIIGACNRDHSGCQDAGSAYVYERQGTTWTQQDILHASDGSEAARFGYSVALDGNWAVIGAYECGIDGVPHAGAAYVFIKNDANWIEQQKLFDADDPNSGEDFGWSVAIEKDTILAGCPNGSVGGNKSGAVFEFVRSGKTWLQQDLLTAPDANKNDGFGSSVALSAGRLIVGSLYDDDAGLNSGSAYIFGNAVTADFDGDCDVDFFDFAVLADSWLQNDPLRDIAPPPAGDGIVDIKDLAVLCDNWLAGK